MRVLQGRGSLVVVLIGSTSAGPAGASARSNQISGVAVDDGIGTTCKGTPVGCSAFGSSPQLRMSGSSESCWSTRVDIVDAWRPPRHPGHDLVTVRGR